MDLLTPGQSLQTVFIWLGILFGALLIFDGLRQLILRENGETKTRNRRMRMISKGVDSEQIFNALTRHENYRRSESHTLLGRLRKALRRANVTLPLGTVLLIPVVLATGGFFALAMFLPLPAALALAGIVGAGLPVLVLVALGQARMDKLVKQLPEALDMMALGLRVGHPIAVTLRRVAREMPDPIGTEFGLIEDRVRHGAEIADAFAEFAERVDIEDVRYMAASVIIQHGTGGNLARVLAVLSKVVRDRLMMRKKISAISAEGRLSGLILSIIPFLIIAVVYTSAPDFYLDVADHPIFMPVAISCGALLVLQVLILRRLTNFEF